MTTGITIVLSVIALIGAFLLGVWWGVRYITTIICNGIKDNNFISDDTKLIVLDGIRVAIRQK